MTQSTPKRKSRRILKSLVAAALIIVLAGFAGLGLACWPPSIHSRPVSDGELIVSALSFEQKLQELLNARLSDLPVQVTVRAEEVNAYLAALQRDELWKQLCFQNDRERERWRPRDLNDVRMSFRGNEACVVGKLPDGPLSLVLSVSLHPQIAPQGTIVFAVTGIKVGHLPIPKPLAKRWFGHISDTTFEQDGDWAIKHMGITGGRLYIWAGPVMEELTRNSGSTGSPP